MREIKKGVAFYPTVNTGGYSDAGQLSVKIVDLSEEEVSANVADNFEQITKPVHNDSGKTSGDTSAGSSTINLGDDHTFKVGELIIISGVGYRVAGVTDTSIDLDKALEVDVADATDLTNTGDTTTYNVECSIDEAVGIVNVVIEHPEMDDIIETFKIVEKTTAELIAEANKGSRKMVAVA